MVIVELVGYECRVGYVYTCETPCPRESLQDLFNKIGSLSESYIGRLFKERGKLRLKWKLNYYIELVNHREVTARRRLPRNTLT